MNVERFNLHLTSMQHTTTKLLSYKNSPSFLNLGDVPPQVRLRCEGTSLDQGYEQVWPVCDTPLPRCPRLTSHLPVSQCHSQPKTPPSLSAEEGPSAPPARASSPVMLPFGAELLRWRKAEAALRSGFRLLHYAACTHPQQVWHERRSRPARRLSATVVISRRTAEREVWSGQVDVWAVRLLVCAGNHVRKLRRWQRAAGMCSAVRSATGVNMNRDLQTCVTCVHARSSSGVTFM